MLDLSNRDRRALREAIQSAYPDRASLEIFVDEQLNRNLAVVAGEGKLDHVVHKLIENAIAKGYHEALILSLASDSPGRPDIQHLCQRVLQQRLVLNPSESTANQLSLEFDPSDWNIDIESEELQSFLPRQFTFEADVGDLQRGLSLASAVCKISFSDRSSAESGTGVLVSPDLVLTNYHVLSRESNANLNPLAKTAQFEFGYVSTHIGEVRQVAKLMADGTDAVVAASPIEQLDYALIRLNRPTEFEIEPVPINTQGGLLPRSPLNILQHPEGEALKVSLSNNGVVKTDEQRGLVLYVNPTQAGSSGSPCFDANWQLVALHHRALQTSFGSVREGILLSAIYPQIVSELENRLSV